VDHLSQSVQAAYAAASGRSLSEGEATAVVTAILNFNGLASMFLAHPSGVASTLFGRETTSGYVGIPLYQIDLRNALHSKKLVSSRPVTGFTLSAAKRLLQDYDILLVVDPAKLSGPSLDVGSVIVWDRSLSLGSALVRVMTRERLDSELAATTMRIVKEEYPETEVFPITDPPGMAVPKLASIDGMEKFIVNIPTMDVNNESHNARNEDEAVNNALNAKRDPNKVNPRDPKYTAQYWQQSGFWNQIVHKANSKQTTKTAEAKQVCGRVLKRIIGLYETNPTLVLETPETMYSIRLTGERTGTNGLNTLDKLVGKTICALGLIEDSLFVISQFSMLNAQQTPKESRMERKSPKEMTTFKVGDRVRKRNRGLAFQQIEGFVKKIEKNLMFVKWNGIKDLEVFNLTDTVAIFAVIEKI
jgi:hypothetical protein